MPKPGQVKIERANNVLDRRAGYRLAARWGHVAGLEGGGHITELNLNSVPGVNPLWKPGWKTIDPQRYSASKHSRSFGSPPDGRLLAGIAGHSLSFDHFGPPSAEETAAGLSTHGEAPAAKWRRMPSPASARSSFRYGCKLESAQIDFTRTLTLDPTNAVVYCEEQAENLSPYDRPISWNEHVTFGPPFLEPATTIFDMPATHARVCPASFSQRNFLQPDADFQWPNVPRKDGDHWNLRTTATGQFGHYTAQLLDPALDVAFVSACNPRQRLLVVYVFRRADFPWVGNWEESNNRTNPPWNGKTFCRGIEFSTTPFSIPRRETMDSGRLFGESTYRWLPAKTKASVRFLILLFAVPEDFSGVSKVAIDGGVVRVQESGERSRELSVKAARFLPGISTSSKARSSSRQ